MNKQAHCPWVEKHRPQQFDHIVLDAMNKKILENMIEQSYFPNLLLYGPPGTGKTTTIVNLVNAYQEKIDKKKKSLMIHLNASDERGIDIIRNQISSFVNSKPLFDTGMKFVILDEVDYMTKNAQQALRYLLQSCMNNQVRFCLICNYISRIDEGLQNEFLRLRFNQLPEKEIFTFLQKVSDQEKLGLSETHLQSIQTLYKSDIRSMLNFMQSNQNLHDYELKIIENKVWEDLYEKTKNKVPWSTLLQTIQQISEKYNIDKKNIVTHFFNYIIRMKRHIVSPAFLSFVENCMHFQDCKNTDYIHYFLIKLTLFISHDS